MHSSKISTDDAVTFVLGVAASLALAMSSWGSAHPSVSLVLSFGIAVVLLSRSPAELPSKSGIIVINFAPAALVYLALFSSIGQASLFWLIATVIARFGERRKPLTDRIFNVGCIAGAGSALLLVLSLHGSPYAARTVVVVGAACGVYFVVDLALTVITLSRARGERLRSVMPGRALGLHSVCFIGICSLGYLAAVLHSNPRIPAWVPLLLVAPWLTITVATRSHARARESERRTAAVYAIARASATVDDLRDITSLMVSELARLLPGREVNVSDEPPTDSEIGVPLGSANDHRWVVISAGHGREFSADDRLGLETLTNVSVDMLERRRLIDEIARMAKVDGLTGLANRTVLLQRLAQVIEEAEPGRAAVLYLDIDGFKGINDRLGHAMGDRALVLTADRLRRTLRDADIPARLGGDEFAVVVPDVDEPSATALGERIVAAFEEPLDLAGRHLRVSVSVGVGMVQVGDSPEAVLQSADTAMYAAKTAGKGRVKVYDPEARWTIERTLILEDSLRIAVAEESLWLAWQPIVDLSTGQLHGFEVLIRWTDPVFGPVAPDILLPIVTRTGLMPALGRWILSQACEQARTLSAAAGRPLFVAVNVAPEQLDDERFIEMAAAFAAEPAFTLVLELTEHTLIDAEQANRVLDRLHSAGANISLDDFGSGYSSMDYLHRFNGIDAIKIDRSFVFGLAGNPRTRTLVHAMTAMAGAFDANVVAEGIEDWASAEVVRTLGCQLGQGYLFGRPEPIETALEVAARGRVEGDFPGRLAQDLLAIEPA